MIVIAILAHHYFYIFKIIFLTWLVPLLYVFMVQDFKDKVRKSILNVFETAFQEEVSHSHTDTKSVDTSQRLDESVLNTQV